MGTSVGVITKKVAQADPETLRQVGGMWDLALSMLSRGSGAILAFAANILIARLLGPANFGSYMTLLSVGLIAGGISAFGAGPVLTREISKASSESRLAMVVSAGRWALGLTTRVSLVAMVVAAAWLVAFPGVSSGKWLGKVAALGIIPAFAWSTVVVGLLAGLAQVAKSQAIANILKNGALFLGVIVFYAAGAATISGLLFLQACSLLFASGIGLRWIVNAIAHGRSPLGKTLSPVDRSTRMAWQGSARRFLVMSVTWLFLGRIDVIIVSALSNSTQAGYFAAAARTAQLANVATLVWIAWMQPRVSEAAHFERLPVLNRLVLVGFIGSVSFAGVLIATAWFVAPSLMHLMGPGFQAAVIPFRWLLFGYLIWATGAPFFALLSMGNREIVLSRILWMQLLLTLLTSVPLVKQYGALGAAVAWSAGMAFAGVCVVIFGCIRLRKNGCFTGLP